MKEWRELTWRPGAVIKMTALVVVTTLAMSGCAAPTATTAQAADPVVPPDVEQDTPWPRLLISEDYTFEVHQPQPQAWDGRRLTGLSAVSVQKQESTGIDYGVLKLAVTTAVDKAERLVYLSDLEVVEAVFPADPNLGREYLARLNEIMPEEVKMISLDRLETTLEVIEEKRGAEVLAQVRNDPPRFVFSTVPALLIMVDGEPVYGPVEGTGMESVLNTHAVLLRDPGGKHYLHLFDGFLEAPALAGPWSVADSPPAAARAAKEELASRGADPLSGPKDPETGKSPSLGETTPPVVHIAGSPTELIVTDGEPHFVAIAGTALEYVDNTTANLFRHTGEGATYVLTSGRWFRAASLDGPWQFVPGSDLPQDFSRIADESPKENVKASIPGTAQAREARIANAIPNMSRIDPQLAMAPIDIDGEAVIEPIPGTDLSYVVNTAVPVIRATGESWYALDKGVWFTAVSLEGPWAVARSVPPSIYAIGPESPLHYVTYVQIYGIMEDGDILVGYTPGYYGTVVGPDGTVLYGTGHTYTTYVSETVYVPQPATYGCGCDMVWTPWGGWAFGFAMGWAIFDDDYYYRYPYYGYYPPAPRWGPYGAYWNDYGGTTAWGPGGWAGTTGNIYHNRGDWQGVSRGAAGYNAYTGNEWARQYGRAYNSRTGVQAAGHRGTVTNVYTDRSVTGGRAVAYNPNTGRVGGAAGVRGDSGAALRVGGDVYAGRDGNVYRREGGSWNQVGGASSHAVRDAQRVNSLDRNWQGRELGSQRYQSFQSSRPPTGSVQRSFNAGGGMRAGRIRGGGGRRR